MADEVRSIPVPAGWSVEQAWETLRRGDEIPHDDETTWVTVLTRDGHLVYLYEGENA